MIFRTLIFTIILFTFSFSSFQEVRIGKIDTFYKDKINKQELRNILDEIEYLFESTLNVNVFDYSSSGKEINIVYVAPSLLEKRISKKLEKIELEQKKIEQTYKSIPKKQKRVNRLKKEFESKNNKLSKKVNKFNNYVKEINRKKTLTRNEYNKVQTSINTQNKQLNKELKKLKVEQREVKKEIRSFNKTVRSYNNMINRYNRLNQELEVMSRSLKKVKGMTFGIKEIKLKTFYKDGKRVQEKSVRKSMDKIEIYGFKNLKELKTVLAHEILHLVGLPHIQGKNTLMNPILQKSQLENMHLTNEDIRNFEENF